MPSLGSLACVVEKTLRLETGDYPDFLLPDCVIQSCDLSEFLFLGKTKKMIVMKILLPGLP